MKLTSDEETEQVRLTAAILDFDGKKGGLPGIATTARRESLVLRILESQRRDRYIAILEKRSGSSSFLTDRDTFEPPRAIIEARNSGAFDEACWLVFLMTHFASHRHHKWTAAREIYFGESDDRWTWEAICVDLIGFRDWLEQSQTDLKQRGVLFGNHRKYESLSGWSRFGTGAVVASYLTWVGDTHSHADLFAQFDGGNSAERFEEIYRSMSKVHRFGRLAIFDYLMSLHRFQLLDVKPGHAYLSSATGPRTGAQLLFGKQLSAKHLHDITVEFGNALAIGFDVVEDAICNWQKDPSSFTPFRG